MGPSAKTVRDREQNCVRVQLECAMRLLVRNAVNGGLGGSAARAMARPHQAFILGLRGDLSRILPFPAYRGRSGRLRGGRRCLARTVFWRARVAIHGGRGPGLNTAVLG